MSRLHQLLAFGPLTLPLVALYAVAVWVATGLLAQHLWPHIACFGATTLLLLQLSQLLTPHSSLFTLHSSLFTPHSSLVACTFLMLSCTTAPLFTSFSGALMQLTFVAALFALLPTYQDSSSVGYTYTAFLCMGLSTVAWMPVALYVPVLWVLMATQLQSLSVRTWLASLLGLLTPHWLLLCYTLYQQGHTPATLVHHMQSSLHWGTPAPLWDAPQQALPLLLVVVLALLGCFALSQQRSAHTTRSRQLYGFFLGLTSYTIILLLVAPQHAPMLLRLAFVVASPHIALLLAPITWRPPYARWGAIFFIVVVVTTIVLTRLALSA